VAEQATSLARSPVVVIAVGGLDPRGASGVLRDKVTAQSLSAHCHIVLTAKTTQQADAPGTVEPCEPSTLRETLREALNTVAPTASRASSKGPQSGSADAPRAAVKIGMVPNAICAQILADTLPEHLPVIFDPVLATSAGLPLYRDQAPPREGLKPLLRRATLVTPNRQEAETLGLSPDDMGRTQNVLFKGGHGHPLASVDTPKRSIDVLVGKAFGLVPLHGPRVTGRDPRGTGCALATAIAVACASGTDLPQACARSKAWLFEQIKASVRVRESSGLPSKEWVLPGFGAPWRSRQGPG